MSQQRSIHLLVYLLQVNGESSIHGCSNYVLEKQSKLQNSRYANSNTAKYSASERRILITRWVGEAWELVSNELKESIIRSFRKCGITIALDGSEDNDINIRGLEDYTVGVQSSESGDTSSGSDDEYEHEPNSGDEDAVGE